MDSARLPALRLAVSEGAVLCASDRRAVRHSSPVALPDRTQPRDLWLELRADALQVDDLGPNECSHRERVLGEIDDLAAQCGRLESLTKPDLRWLRTLVDRNRNALEVPFEPTFVHHDFTATNVVVSRGPAAWSVSGVFDLMEAYMRAPGRGSMSSAPKAALVVTLRPSSAALGRCGGCVASRPRLPFPRHMPCALRHLEGAGA